MYESQPILRPIDAAEAAQISPWPDRLAGVLPWQPRARSQQAIDAEYDRGWYADLSARWTAFAAKLPPHQRHPGTALHFFDEVRRTNNDAMVANSAIYGNIDLERYLVSVADRLYAADLNLLEVLFRMFVVERAARARAVRSFEAVVEIGCGAGVNLFNLYNHLGLRFIAGCELSPSAVRFLRTMSADLGVAANFEAGDYCNVEVIRSLVREATPWALFSVHTIEQVRNLPADWFERVVHLPNPPRIALHFEPIQWGDDGPLAESCRRYRELNGYNHGFLQMAQRAEADGLIEIVRTEKRALGHSAYNPTSLLMWIPADQS